MKLLYEQLTDIPIGFTEVEYLATTNQQNNQSSATDVSWIDTGIAPSDTTKLECRMAFTTLISGNANEALFGTTSSNAGNYRFAWGFASLSPYTNFYVGLGGQNMTTTVTRDTNVHTFTIDAVNKTWGIDSATGSFTSSGSLADTGSIFLFARHNIALTDNVANKPANARVYYCKIWNNNTLVRDFVPCLDSSNIPCMWDKVTKTAYYNQGTGTFSYGRKIIPVEYLESTGTQYIDTNYAFTDNFSWEIDFEGISDGCTLFGGRTSSARTALLYQRNYGGIDKTTCPIAGYNGQETPFQLDDLRIGRHAIKMSVASNKGSVWVDGSQVYNEQSFTGTYISGTTQALFADNFGTSVSEYTSSKVYNLKMWQGSNIIRDYIPCIDENGVGYMFDKVTHSCYLNAGSGSFLVGNELPKQKLRFLKDNKLRLPNGFTEVEYLQSTGTQYIMSGLSMPNGFRVKGTLVIDDLSATGGIFGCYTNSSPYYRNFFDFTSANNWLVGFGGGAYQYFGSNVTNTKYTFNICNVHNNEQLEINGTSYTVSPTGSTGDFSSFEMPVFALNVSGTISNISKIKLYCLQIYNENDVLVRDYVPCLDANNVPCLWDRVENKAYYNAGTGTFNYGKKIIPVKYLESSGTQYIDTGIVAKSGIKSVLDFEYTSITDTASMLDARSGNNRLYLCHVGKPSNTFYFYFGYGSATQSSTVPTTNTRYLIETDLSVGSQSMKVNGISIATGSSSTTYNLGVNLYLFGMNYGTPQYLTFAKLYSCKIMDGSTLVRDYMPAIDENSVGYMFDTISHSLYANAGTGSFVVGNEIKNVTRFLEGA